MNTMPPLPSADELLAELTDAERVRDELQRALSRKINEVQQLRKKLKSTGYIFKTASMP